MERLMELVEKEKITIEEAEEIQEMPEVIELENNGNSGRYYGYCWYTVKTEDGTEYDVYVK